MEKRTLRNALLGLLLPCLALPAMAQAPAMADEQEVWRRVEALTQAVFVQKDGNALRELFDDRLSYGHSSGALETKAEAITNAVASRNSYRDLSSTRASLVVSPQQRTAVVRQVLQAQQTDAQGKESTLKLGILLVWVQADGQWRLLARQAVRLAQP